MRFAAIFVGGLVALLSLCASNDEATARSADADAADSVNSDQYLIRTTIREQVEYNGKYAPGTIIVDTSERFLYYVLKNKKAIRYGVGVGREGYSWSGVSHVPAGDRPDGVFAAARGAGAWPVRDSNVRPSGG